MSSQTPTPTTATMKAANSSSSSSNAQTHLVSLLRSSVPPSPRSSLHGDSEATPLLHDDPENLKPHDDDEGAEKRRLSCTPTLRGILVSLLVLLGITAVCCVAVFLRTPKEEPRPPIPPNFPSEPRNPAFLVSGQNGAVAAEDKTCSEVGVGILKDGGNAVDAAIAATLCGTPSSIQPFETKPAAVNRVPSPLVGVMNMFASGIGGGGFSIIRLPPHSPSNPSNTSRAYTVDFRETAPSASNETMFGTDPILPKWGGLAIGVPGELRGFEEMHRRWGRISWREVVRPAERVARGWRVSAELARRFQVYGSFILTNPDWLPVFAPNGQLLKEGDYISRMAYSRTLNTIAEKGAEAFYSGPIANSSISKIQSKGGIMTLSDLQSYKPIVRPALEGTYRDKKIYTTHAPTSGPVVLNMLNVLEHYDLVGEGRTQVNVHRLVEAMKFGFAARTRIADPAFLKDVEDVKFLDSLITKEYAEKVYANITDDRTHLPGYYQPMYDVMEDHGTTHTSVVDSDGMAVGITSTVNLIFGSQVHDPETGIIFNDEMDDFATYRTPNGFGLYPSPYNYPQPGKRPLSSTAPTVLEHASTGLLHVVLGGSGGSRIFGSIVQTLLGLDWGLDISAAIEAPRVHDQLFPPYVAIESGLNPEEISALVGRGHPAVVEDINLGVSEVQAVHVAPNGTLFAASDSRKHGVAAAY